MTRKVIFFQGQAANGISSNVFSSQFKQFMFYIASSGVTSGATVAIQSQSPVGDWYDLDNRAITSGYKTLVRHEGPASQIRAVISGYVDGGYTVSAEGY